MAGSHKVADLCHRGCQPSVDGYVPPDHKFCLLKETHTRVCMRTMRTVCTRKSPAFAEYYMFAVSPDRTYAK